MIDILYVSWNRLRFTQESFSALVANTDWSKVKGLYIHDDGSTDGTFEWLEEQALKWRKKTEFVLHGDRLGGPVAAINWYLDVVDPEVDTFAKIDNDFVVCPRWLDVMLHLHYLNPNIDIYGIEPMKGTPTAITDETIREFKLEEAEHIGGKGLIRRRAFERSGCRPVPSGKHGYQGFTQWQWKHPIVIKAWVAPDLPCFGLDQLPLEPWREITAQYVANGWQRAWDEYRWDDVGYWGWWIDNHEEKGES